MHLPLLSNLIAAALLALAGTAGAYDKPVEKKVFSLPSYTTAGGKPISQVRVGYETYGTLNAAGDNADLHRRTSISGTSHAAGKYKPKPMRRRVTGTRSSGAGKPIDTDKYFVVSAPIPWPTSTPRIRTSPPPGPASHQPGDGQALRRCRFLSFRCATRCACTRALRRFSLGVKKLQSRWPVPRAARCKPWSGRRNYPDFVERVDPRHRPRDSRSSHPWVIEPARCLWMLADQARPEAGTMATTTASDEPLDGRGSQSRSRTGDPDRAPRSAGQRRPTATSWADRGKESGETSDVQRPVRSRMPSQKAGHGACQDHGRQQQDLHGEGQPALQRLTEGEVGQDQGKDPLRAGGLRPEVFPPELSRRSAAESVTVAQGGKARRSSVIDGRRRPPRWRAQRGEGPGEAIRGFMAR
jgi:hypothetical protein